MLTGLTPRNQDGVPPGRWHDFLRALTHEDPVQRPRTASQALRMLREAGVPSGTPWATDPDPPEVVDRIGPVPPLEAGTPPSAAASYVALLSFGLSIVMTTAAILLMLL
jgi:serine/threonine-protein kinase